MFLTLYLCDVVCTAEIRQFLELFFFQIGNIIFFEESLQINEVILVLCLHVIKENIFSGFSEGNKGVCRVLKQESWVETQ